MSMTPSTAPTARRDHAAARRPQAAGAARHSSGLVREASDPLTSFRLRTAAVENAAAARATRLAVARAKQGDREALRYLYVRYADNVYSYVASIVRNHHEAEDVTQQVFAKLIDSLAPLRGSRRALPQLAGPARAQRRDRPAALAPRDPAGRPGAREPRQRGVHRSRPPRQPAQRAWRPCRTTSARSSCCATSAGWRRRRSPRAWAAARAPSTACTTAGAARCALS